MKMLGAVGKKISALFRYVCHIARDRTFGICPEEWNKFHEGDQDTI
jgi:hypothetical protein